MIKRRKHGFDLVDSFGYEEIGKKYLRSLGYREIKVKICVGYWGSPTCYDYTGTKDEKLGVVDFKCKILPSTQPHVIDYTMNQIEFFQKYFDKKRKLSKEDMWDKKLVGCNVDFFKVLIIVIYPNEHHEFKLLDINKDFMNPYRDITNIGVKMRYSEKLCKWYCNGRNPIRLRVKKEKRTW